MAVTVRQLAIQIAAMAVVFTVILFVPAGTLAWPAAWVFLVLFFGFTVALSLWLLRFNPDLLAERLTGIGKPDQKAWDKMLLVITFIAVCGWLVLMGLDAIRFRWSRVPLWLQALGALLLLCSFYVFYLTFRGKPILVFRRSHPEGKSSDRGEHWPLSLCPAPHVRWCHPLRLWGWWGPCCLSASWARRAVLGGTNVAR